MIGFPISDSQAEVIMIDRGINSAGEYTGKTQSMNLAKADALMLAANSPNVSEGGYSISLQDRKNMISEANAIYLQYGEKPKGKPSVNNASDKW